MLAIRRESQGGVDVFCREFREIGEDFRIAHAGSQPAENIIDGDPHMTDAGFPPPVFLNRL